MAQHRRLQRIAEIVGEFVSKGSKVYVEGKLQTTSWEDRQSGERKYRTQVVARDLVLLDSRRNVKTARRQPIMLQMKVRRRPPHPAKLWKTSPSWSEPDTRLISEAGCRSPN